MIRFSATVEGEEVLSRAFNRVEFAIADLTPIWKEVQQEFYEIEKEQFQSSGAAGASGKWKELSPKYEEIKIARYGFFALAAGPLRATDAMYKSLTRETEDSVTVFEKQEATFGTSLHYAEYHQKGGGRLPQRKPIDPSDVQLRRIQKAIQKGLIKEVRESEFVITEENFEEIG